MAGEVIWPGIELLSYYCVIDPSPPSTLCRCPAQQLQQGPGDARPGVLQMPAHGLDARVAHDGDDLLDADEDAREVELAVEGDGAVVAAAVAAHAAEERPAPAGRRVDVEPPVPPALCASAWRLAWHGVRCLRRSASPGSCGSAWRWRPRSCAAPAPWSGPTAPSPRGRFRRCAGARGSSG